MSDKTDSIDYPHAQIPLIETETKPKGSADTKGKRSDDDRGFDLGSNTVSAAGMGFSARGDESWGRTTSSGRTQPLTGIATPELKEAAIQYRVSAGSDSAELALADQLDKVAEIQDKPSLASYAGRLRDFHEGLYALAAKPQKGKKDALVGKELQGRASQLLYTEVLLKDIERAVNRTELPDEERGLAMAAITTIRNNIQRSGLSEAAATARGQAGAAAGF